MPDKSDKKQVKDVELVEKIDAMMSKSSKTAPEVSPEVLKAAGIDKETRPKAKSVVVEPPAVEPDKDAPDDSPEPVSEENELAPVNLDDSVSDKAVDEIVADEGDAVLAAEDAAHDHAIPAVRGNQGSSGWRAKLKALFTDKRFWIVFVALLIVLGAVPYTRYKIIGLAIKRTVTISVVDSKTKTPVSSAAVTLGGAQAKTNGDGKATLNAKPGKQQLTIDKQYYKKNSVSYFVSLGQESKVSTKLVATGRQVPITVLNKITGKPVRNAEIAILKTAAKTDKNGKAIIVLPASTLSNSARISYKGFNTTTVTVKVTDQVIPENTFKITPAGHVYFLSNRSGNIDVVKTNLDGSGRRTVLEGTGKEDDRTTNLLASRDWRYVVLKARRDTAQPALYLIDTQNDKVTQFESGDVDLTLVGWYNHNFMYHAVRKTVPQSQAGHEVLKSYDAEQTQLNQLDQTQAEGTATSYAYQSFYNFYIVDGVVVYNVQWQTYNAGEMPPSLSGKNVSIRGVQANGQGKKDYQNFDASVTGYIDAALYEPQSTYYGVYNNQINKTSYYEYEDRSVKQVTDVAPNIFNRTYPTYLLSPGSTKTFWAEPRDGKNTLFLGDAKGASKKQIASLGNYNAYGWYSDNYLLVSKTDSELYILPVGGLSNGQQPLKITDYYKPSQTYAGYGYGYGGL